MNRSLLFLKANSRLGLLRPPLGETHTNEGVEYGPDAILTPSFLQQLGQNQIISFEFTRPQFVNRQNYFSVLAKQNGDLIDQITQNLTPQTTLVTVGGDHSVAFASIASMLRQHDPADVGVLMIDSHADLHQPSTSPSGNFHGMWLRPLIDQFEVEEIDQLLPAKLPTSNLLYIGNLDREPAEIEFMKQQQIINYDRQSLTDPTTLQQLSQFITSKKHLQISLDIDVFSHQFAPATGMMITNGLTPDDVIPILQLAQQAPSLSIDLVEVNPTLEGNQKTVAIAQQLIQFIVS